MTVWFAIVVFLLSLGLSIVSSIVLATGLDKIGARLGLTEGLLGIITALGANAPEISAAVAALITGSHDVGVGVIIGSNILNLAALLGLSAVVAGGVHIRREGLLFNGVVAVLVTAAGAALIFHIIGPLLALALIAVVLVPYAAIAALRPSNVQDLPPGSAAKEFLHQTVDAMHREARGNVTAPKASWTDALAVVPALVSVVLASTGMVQSSTALGHYWGVPDHIVGMLFLAGLTGIPNVLAAIRLAKAGRGSAVVSEALNSNSLNVLSGICLPMLFLTLGQSGGQTQFAVWWLLGMTLLLVAMTGLGGGLSRREGMATIALYAVFAIVVIVV